MRRGVPPYHRVRTARRSRCRSSRTRRRAASSPTRCSESSGHVTCNDAQFIRRPAPQTPCNQCTNGFRGTCAARPGINSGLTRCGNAVEKPINSSGGLIPAWFSAHRNTDAYASARFEASSVPRAGQATRTTRSKTTSLPRTSSISSSASSRCFRYHRPRMHAQVAVPGRRRTNERSATSPPREWVTSGDARRFGKASRERQRVLERAAAQSEVIEGVNVFDVSGVPQTWTWNRRTGVDERRIFRPQLPERTTGVDEKVP